MYVHCTCGIGRAPSTVVLYLTSFQRYTLEEALKLVKTKRPAFFINYSKDLCEARHDSELLAEVPGLPQWDAGRDEAFIVRELNYE